MNIGLIGHGKMGKEIEKIVKVRGHNISLIIDAENLNDLRKDNLQNCDVAIEFTRPESAFNNLKKCIDAGIPVISGTTGWLDKKPELDNYCRNNNGSYLYASNYSIGVNILFALNKKLAELIAPYKEYKCQLTEIHHTTKLDAPSGTAITLAEDIIERHKGYQQWVNSITKDSNVLPIISKRIADAPGTHTISYDSPVDKISIHHEAVSRQGFATGAVIAAEWIIGKIGVFTMNDVLGF